jgi:hypothetical protein
MQFGLEEAPGNAAFSRRRLCVGALVASTARRMRRLVVLHWALAERRFFGARHCARCVLTWRGCQSQFSQCPKAPAFRKNRQAVVLANLWPYIASAKKNETNPFRKQQQAAKDVMGRLFLSCWVLAHHLASRSGPYQKRLGDW